MTGKRIQLSGRPATDPSVDSWVRDGDRAGTVLRPHADPHTARLTIDVTPAMRGRIKIAAIRQGSTVTDMLRALLEREFPDEKQGNE
jgi:hypothetical protein